MKCELGAICSRLSSGKSISAKLVSAEGKYPVYGGNGLRGYSNVSNFDGECAIIGRQGAFCGNVRYFKGAAYMTEHAIVVCADGKNDTRYLAYLLSHMQLGRLSAQSAQPGLSVKTLSKQIVDVPLLETQKRIAAILSSLDDKIENNKRINRHLEQMAQALFKAWFVDFTPFGGKMPKDWKRGTLKGIISTIETGARPRGGAVNEGIPSIGAENIEGLGIYNFENEKYIGIDFFRKLRRGKITDGDVLLYKDGAYTGKVSMALDGFPHRKAAVNEHVFLLRSREQKYQFYLYLLLKQRTFYKMLNTVASSKAAQPGLNQTDLLSIEIILPDESWLLNFERKISGIMHQMATSARESRILSQVRDSLLPRLMSGKIKIEKQRS